MIVAYPSYLNSQANNISEAPQPAVAPHMLSWIRWMDDDTRFVLPPAY